MFQRVCVPAAGGLISARFLRALICVIPLASGLVAQNETGRIMGVVTDPSGAVVRSAKITVRETGTGLTQVTATDQTGAWAVPALPAGRYVVVASAPGFANAQRTGLSVSAGAQVTLDLNLLPTPQTNSVTVTGLTAGDRDTLAPELIKTNDTAELASDFSGIDLLNDGGLSGIPAIHGLADERVAVRVDGMEIGSACVMHMNPPLSYLDPSQAGNLDVIAGITPVSRGGDSIGGTVAVDTAPPEFSTGSAPRVHGNIEAFHRTNGVANGGSASLAFSTKNFQIGYTGSYVNANDYKDGAGLLVASTFYEAQKNALQASAREGNNLFSIGIGYQYIPQQGFPNAFLDMTGNQAKFANFHYQGKFSWFSKEVTLEGRLYYENTRHSMDILRDKVPGVEMPMFTRGANLGYLVQTEIPLSARDTLRAGHEFRRFTLDDWWTPATNVIGTLGPNTLLNVNNGRRNRFGTWAEWEARRSKRWTTLLGIRSDIVLMDTGDVQGYNNSPAATGDAAYYADAAEFNSAGHARQDYNFDLTALARFDAAPFLSIEAGYARKTRSPSIYERYLWAKRSFFSADMEGWFGDLNGYTGNLDLKPEVAHTISSTISLRDATNKGWELRITPYYTRIQNYIDAGRCPLIDDGSDGCTAANFTATSGFAILQFANYPAKLYGFDGSFRAPLGQTAAGRFSLAGTLGEVRGENLDTKDNLYRLMPFHGDLSLQHERGGWSGAFSLKAVDAKTRVDAVRIELPTAGFALLSLRGGYRWKLAETASVRLDAGIENLANRQYDLPLGGRYWTDFSGGSSVPGLGRSFLSGLSFTF
jgi:iron complex outermembrane receptor protein